MLSSEHRVRLRACALLIHYRQSSAMGETASVLGHSGIGITDTTLVTSTLPNTIHQTLRLDRFFTTTCLADVHSDERSTVEVRFYPQLLTSR